MINWKLRLKNKTTLVAIVMAAISFVYIVLEILGIVPSVDKSSIIKAALGLIDLLAILGIIVDPTTKGVYDSERAMTYDKPYDEPEIGVVDIQEDTEVDE